MRSSIAFALSTLVSHVSAHGYLSQPKASYKPNTVYTTYNKKIGASVNKAFEGGVYNGDPAENGKQFTKHWNATGYKSLRDMIDPICPGYGFSLDTADPVDVSSYDEMWWQNDELKEGFLKSHHGPCEGWIDETMVFHHDDCVAESSSFPAKIPTDFSSCKGSKCLFVFYWLAVHDPKWQIYKQCVPIKNGGSGKASTADQSTKDNSSPDEAAEAGSSANQKTDNGTIANEASQDAAMANKETASAPAAESSPIPPPVTNTQSCKRRT